MMPEQFEKLRDMETFTDSLFDRIFTFQEKKHPAWEPDKPFAERIKNIPLHNLIFSNPDRDSEKFGPTIAHYYPLREENKALVYYMKHVAENPVVLDIHARNGFVGSLLAREGVKVKGLREVSEKPNQIDSFFDADCYEMFEGSLADVAFDVDVVFSSWMPAGQNATPDIFRLKPKMVIYVYTEHINEHSKERQTGTDAAYDLANLPEGYKVIDEWSIARPENLLQEAWPDLSPSIAEERHVRIVAAEPLHNIAQYAPEMMAEPYDWEADLEMAALAMEAKEHLRSRGLVV